MNKGYGNTLTIILIVAIVAIVGVLGFFAYRMYTTSVTNKNAHDKVSEFDENTKNNNQNNNNDSAKKDDENKSEDNTNNGSTSLDDILKNLENNDNNIYNNGNNTSGEKKDTLYNGYKVIGTISIPKINIKYPILEECTSATLKLAIVAYYPEPTAEAVNKVGNLVLWGHNYKNGEFFSDIGKLTTGDKINIKDMSGTTVQYQVYNVYETTDSDITYATRDTEGRKEISLSTCSNQSGKRTIVWASEVK